MIIVTIKAGLGNQMFQYAFGRSLSLKRNDELFLDVSSYEHVAAKDTVRHFTLDKYHIKAHIATKTEIAPFHSSLSRLYRKIKSKIRRDIFKASDYAYDPSIVTSPDSYFEGHWVTERYFKEYQDIIKKDLTLVEPLGSEAKKDEDIIKECEREGFIPVCIHVRHGDYISNPYAASFHGVLDEDYYKNALSYISSRVPQEKLRFFIFSDDEAWAKEHIIPLTPHASSVYISNSLIHDYEELHLMSLCHHHIIANSSFSWWGAWLHMPSQFQIGEPIVIAPKTWVSDPSVNTTDAVPGSWVRM